MAKPLLKLASFFTGLLLGCGVPCLLWALQAHPSVLTQAPETPAEKLHRELGVKKKILIIDVRSPEEFAQGHVPGAINVPVATLTEKIVEMKVPKSTRIVTVCEHGGRSSRAVQELRKLGYESSSFCRLESWKKRGYKIEKGDPDPNGSEKIYRFFCQHSCQTYIETSNLDVTCDHCDCKRRYGECMKGN